MDSVNITQANSNTNRRAFLKTAAAVGGGTLAGVALAGDLLAANVHAAGGDLLKVGLIGCGGRGAGAAAQALKADKHVTLWAMGDAFQDRLESSLAALQRDENLASKLDVDPARRFVGFDAYRQVIDCGVDVVLLTTPPHFRPMHLQYAVEKNKHVFAEKPVAVDAPGVRSVLASCESARKKGLSIVSGLVNRYSHANRETIQRIQDGAIGQILSIQANDFRGGLWVKPRQPDWTDMVYQMRNWYYFTWLSGDFNVEQHIHALDKCSWIKGGYPVRAVGTGGRQTRTAPEFGHIYDHMAVVHDYADGARLYYNGRQQSGTANDISVLVLGAKGRAEFSARKPAIITDQEWRYTGADNNPFQTEHDELFASIRSGTPINNGDYMAHSTLLTIQGRMAAYTGQVITWDQALESKEDLSPPRYAWDVPLPDPPVAMPGVTRFV